MTRGIAPKDFRSPLAPVSEADDSDSTETGSGTSTDRTGSSATSSESHARTPVINFSRPRPLESSLKPKPKPQPQPDRSELGSRGSASATASAASSTATSGKREPDVLPRRPSAGTRTDSSRSVGSAGAANTVVHTLSAFHDTPAAPPSPPGEPLFSPDSSLTSFTFTNHPARPDLGWDLGESLPRPRRPDGYDAQRSASRPRRSRPSTAGTGATAVASLSGPEAPRGMSYKLPTTDRASSDAPSLATTLSRDKDDDGDDARSHHIASEAGEVSWSSASSGQRERERWRGSDYDTSCLSEAEIRKLRKKGIDPALYAEMKAARKGKGKWISPLVGNTYLS